MTATIPHQRTQLVTCPYCPAVVPGLLVGCCGAPECLAQSIRDDEVLDRWCDPDE